MPSFRIAGFLRIIPYNNAGRVTRTRALLSVTINTAILGLMFRGFWIQFSTTNHESLTIQRKGVDYARRVSHMVSIVAGMSNQAYWYILHPTLLKSVFNRIELLSNALKNTTNYTRLNWLLGIITGATATAALLVALLWKGWRWHLIMFMYFFPNMVQVLLITQITALLEISPTRIKLGIRQSLELTLILTFHRFLVVKSNFFIFFVLPLIWTLIQVGEFGHRRIRE
ncbi:unnamed protein product [Nesidiocoris tenuis]|uniref:Uncharacterized protein n=1 Tax=Nesidiocoris tenuis TaxID=355587 RepID=A0A6H5G8D4_9HEMI|nr:unnamed protein product [Nesidiocoris tenuis]